MRKTKLSALLIAVTTVFTLASCDKETGSGEYNYTYNTYMSTQPKTWNVHNWQTSEESYINSFTEMGLYDVILNSTKDGYDFACEMASEYPIQVDPNTLTDEEYDRYYTSNPQAGMVWDIKLNQAAKWEDGTPITSKDYVDSMERLLNPHYANFRADSFYQGELVLANAETYYKQGTETIENALPYIDKDSGSITSSTAFTDGKWYINLGRPNDFTSGIFSNSTGEETFLTALENRSTESGDAVELAAQRIADAVKFYILNNMDRDINAAFFQNNQEDWDNADEQKADDSQYNFAGVNSIDADMLADHPDIDIYEFDSTVVYVRTKKDTSMNSALATTYEQYSSEKLQNDLRTFVQGIDARGYSGKDWAWEAPLYVKVYNSDSTEWENVGIKAIDDYTIRFYLTKSITSLNLRFSLTSNWLVNVKIYDEATQATGVDTQSTRYATSTDTYMSYGPYKLTKADGYEYMIVRNDQWYGYTDGKHVGQYQMDSINTRIITEHDTAMQEFLAGKLDDIELNATDMRLYGQSSRRTTTYESYTQKITINSDRKSLLGRQSGTQNKTALANTNVRKAMSLAIDRNSYAADATAGSKAFTGLLNDLYLSDVATGTAYRSTEQGKSVYNAVYGNLGGDPTVADYTESALSESNQGYNLAMATYLLTEGLKEEVQSGKDGAIKSGDTVTIDFRVYDSESENTITSTNFLIDEWNELFAAASERLISQGVIANPIGIKVNLVKDENYYQTAQNGNFDMIFSIWGGANIDPYGLMQVYCDPEFTQCCEYGFKGKQNQTDIAIDLNGNGVIDTNETKSFFEWYDMMTEQLNEAQYGDEISTSPDDPNYEAWLNVHNQKLTILAGLEAGIVNRWEAIPIVARGTSSLTSFKVENATNVYVSLVGYGGIRFMTFNYDNAGWNEFRASNNLENLYKTL